MRVVFFGTPQFAVPSLNTLMAQPDIDVVAVVTQPDKRRGRGKQLVPSPVKVAAQQHQLPLWQPPRIKTNAETLGQLDATKADAFVVVAYGQILSQTLLDMPRLGCINAHGSILPRYRGAAPIQWSLYHGDDITGITTMLMDAGMDTGAMLLTATTPISLLDNAHTVADRLAQLSADLLVTTLQQLDAGKLDAQPQNPDDATYAPLIQKQDYDLDWSKAAIAIHNQVRGFYPHCGTTLQGQPIKVMATIPLDSPYRQQLPAELAPLVELATSLEISSPSSPGTIVAMLKGYGPVVQTGVGLLLLYEVQPAGKRPQSGWDFVNGNRLTIGNTFTSSSP